MHTLMFMSEAMQPDTVLQGVARTYEANVESKAASSSFMDCPLVVITLSGTAALSMLLHSASRSPFHEVPPLGALSELPLAESSDLPSMRPSPFIPPIRLDYTSLLVEAPSSCEHQLRLWKPLSLGWAALSSTDAGLLHVTRYHWRCRRAS